MEALGPSGTSVNFHQNAWCHMQENRHFHGYSLEHIIPLFLSVLMQLVTSPLVDVF